MSTIISAVVIIGLIALIIWLLIYFNNKEQDKKAALCLIRLNKLAIRNNLSLSEIEILKDTLFGIDPLLRKLVILEPDADGAQQHQIIELDSVIRCSLQENNRTVYQKGSSGTVHDIFIEQISLLFEFADKRPSYSLVFYQHIIDHISEMPDLEKKAIKWQEQISQHIKQPLRRIA